MKPCRFYNTLFIACLSLWGLACTDPGRPPSAEPTVDMKPSVDMGSAVEMSQPEMSQPEMSVDGSCGDGVIQAEAGEECDGQAGVDGLTCQDRGGGVGPLSCDPMTCKISRESCRTITQVALGFAHTCALLDDGTVSCWGAGASGQLGVSKVIQSTPVKVPGLDKVSAIAAGDAHTCALREGKVLCWGGNSKGQLGDGAQLDSLLPKEVQNLTDVESIALGVGISCALKQGKVYCWGANTKRLINPNAEATVFITSPRVIDGLADVEQFDVSYDHLCAVSMGKVYCLGDNTYGQLGDGTKDDRLSPVEVAGLTGVSAVHLQSYTSCASKADGIYCWGQNKGAFGDGTLTDSVSPTRTQGLDSVDMFSGSCALSKGDAYCWGRQFGEYSASDVLEPKLVSHGQKVKLVASNAYVACFVDTNESLFCFGKNKSGEVGNGKSDQLTTPVDLGFDLKFKSVEVGARMSCGVTVIGDVYCWGNVYKADGTGREYSKTPVKVEGVSNVSLLKVSNFGDRACIVDVNKRAYCWGYVADWLNLPSSANYSLTSINIGGDIEFLDLNDYNLCVLNVMGEVYCVGLNNRGQVGVGKDSMYLSVFELTKLNFPGKVVRNRSGGCRKKRKRADLSDGRASQTIGATQSRA